MLSAAPTPNIDRYRQHFPHAPDQNLRFGCRSAGRTDGETPKLVAMTVPVNCLSGVDRIHDRMRMGIWREIRFWQPLWAIATSMIPPFICSAFRTAECTAATHLYALLGDGSSIDREKVYVRCFYGDGRDVRPSGRVMRAGESAACYDGVGGIRSWAATMPWTGITAGSGSKKPIAPWYWVRKRCGR